MPGVKNVVLVHGAWANGSSWSKIIPLLLAKGLHAVAVQNPLSSIADDVASTNRLINAQDGPVLLVGHSYGGAVITEAGNNPKVAGLVYVAAFAPEEGETLGGMAQKFPPTPTFGEIQPIDDGYLLLTRKGIFDFFAQDLAPAEKELVLAEPGWADYLIDALAAPPVAWLLLLIGGAALYAELQAPGIGIGGNLFSALFLEQAPRRHRRMAGNPAVRGRRVLHFIGDVCLAGHGYFRFRGRNPGDCLVGAGQPNICVAAQ